MMRRVIPSLVAATAALALGLGSLALRAQPAGASEDAAVRDLMAQYQALREKGDAAGLAALFTADADQLVSSGEWRKGRDAVVKGSLASTQQSGGKRTMTIETVRTLSPGVAIADARYDLTQNDGTVRHMWAAWLVVKDGAAWKIAAIRNMLPAAPAGAATPAR